MTKDKKAAKNPSLWGRMSRRFSSQSHPEPDDEQPTYQVFPIPRGAGTAIIAAEPGLAPPPPPHDTNKTLTDDNSYIIEHNNHTLWPCFTPNEGNSDWTIPDILADDGDPVRHAWTRGKGTNNQFGARMFPSRARPPRESLNDDDPRSHLPPLLFDLQSNSVVHTCDLLNPSSIEYIVVSHVWGDSLTILPGPDYGVKWPVPITNVQKLAQILSACHAVGGIRYIWLDVLCFNQRNTDQDRSELARMKTYWEEGAAGCLVWLDNPSSDPDWERVLHSIREVNRVYGMDKSSRRLDQRQSMGVPSVPVMVPEDAASCFRLLRNLTLLEHADWFHRVWTLQEGVLPEHLLFVTPEGYVLDRSCLFGLVEALGDVAQRTMDGGLRWGVGLLQELQRSEIWKMLKVKQLHAAGKLSYMHVFHALKTRRCRRDADRFLGAWGLIGGLMPEEISREAGADTGHELYRAYYRMSLEKKGDFSSLMFVGGGDGDGSAIWHTAESMGLVFGADSAPLCVPGEEEVDTHNLSLTVSGEDKGLKMQDVGYDTVSAVHCLSAKGNIRTWGKMFGTFHDYLESERKRVVDVTRASGLPASTALLADGRLGPGYLAAILPWKTGRESQLKRYDAAFLEDLRLLAVRTVVMALQCRWLEARLDDSAVVVVWTKSNAAQLAVVTEPIDQLFWGHTVTVMPRSYSQNPGKGCLICVREESGQLRKLGIGLGENLRAAGTGTFVLR